jgi:hypothetical protein
MTAPTSPVPWSSLANEKLTRLLPQGQGARRGFDADPSDGFDVELNSNDRKGRALGTVVDEFGEMSDDVYIIAEVVAEELATEHTAIYTQTKEA